tara:strand:+ start:240 stop:1412 length:1173 start_codon:yes stop_codon:yes gene_type:complete
MTYALLAAVVLILIISYIYLKPKEKVTKNIFNAEYYRGLNYLLNNEEDKAFKIFTALMDVDSSTVETHLALGGLYRKRGEFDKAILIHQNLLSRPTLESELKNQALYELARDFHSAGLYDRSEKIFKNLSETSKYKHSCEEQLIKLYESTNDWSNALKMVEKSKSPLINNHKPELLLSQYLCEISSEYYKNSEVEKSVTMSKKAIKIDPACMRANLQLAKYYSHNDINASSQYYYLAINQNYKFCKYIVSKIIELAKRYNSSNMIMKTITDIAKKTDLPFIPDVYLFLFYEKNDKLADYYIQQHKDQSEVTNFLVNHTVAVAHQTNENHLSDDLIQSSKHIFTNDSYFFCNNCGYKSSILNWLCPKCNTWNDVIPKTNIDIIEEISFDKR